MYRNLAKIPDIDRTSTVIIIGFLVVSLLPVLFWGRFPRGEDSGKLLLILLLGYGGGLFWFAGGFHRFRQLQLVKNTPTSKIRSLAMGSVEIEGKASSKGEPIISPMTQKDCVFYVYRVEEYRNRGKHNYWETVDKGRSHEKFKVKDDTGEIMVDPEGLELFLDYDINETVDEHDEPSKNIQRFIEADPKVEEKFNSAKTPLHNDKRRYREKTLMPDENIYIFGKAARDPETDQVILEEGDPMYAISDSSEKQFQEELESRYHKALFGGALVAIISYAILLAVTGVL